MKNNFYIVLCSILLLMSGCYDREIIDSKEGDPLAPVTGLAYTVSGPDVTLTWTLPTQFPSDVILPVSVMVTVYRNNTLILTKVTADAPTTYTYTEYNPENAYRFIVKVQAAVDTDDLNKSKLRLSPGVTVTID